MACDSGIASRGTVSLDLDNFLPSSVIFSWCAHMCRDEGDYPTTTKVWFMCHVWDEMIAVDKVVTRLLLDLVLVAQDTLYSCWLCACFYKCLVRFLVLFACRMCTRIILFLGT
jgi:hypothetical protein